MSVASKDKTVQVGDLAPDFTLVDVSGTKHTLSHYRGSRVILSFYSFASCVLCNFSIDRLKQQNNYLRSGGITVICVFQSPPEQMRQFVVKQTSPPFTMLCDPSLGVYGKYNVKCSAMGLFLGVCKFRANGSLKEARAKGFKVGLKPDGPRSRMPAEFLIDEEGKVVDIFRAKSADQHMPWERIEAFIPKQRRCNCGQSDCLSLTCQQKMKEVKEADGGGIFLG